MNRITHHIPGTMLAAYAAGNLPPAYELVIAAHVSMCDACRAELGAHEAAGGALLETTEAAPVSDKLKSRVLDGLDAPDRDPEPLCERSGIFPGPVMTALGGQPPKWRSLGMGVRQSILSRDAGGSARLLYIPAGQAVPDHSHGGIELTLVLQGAFSDETGRFGIGDVEVADDTLEHTPVAEPGNPCVCLAATDAPLRFRALMPRLLQPIFRI